MLNLSNSKPASVVAGANVKKMCQSVSDRRNRVTKMDQLLFLFNAWAVMKRMYIGCTKRERLMLLKGVCVLCDCSLSHEWVLD